MHTINTRSQGNSMLFRECICFSLGKVSPGKGFGRIGKISRNMASPSPNFFTDCPLRKRQYPYWPSGGKSRFGQIQPDRNPEPTRTGWTREPRDQTWRPPIAVCLSDCGHFSKNSILGQPPRLVGFIVSVVFYCRDYGVFGLTLFLLLCGFPPDCFPIPGITQEYRGER